MYITLIIIEKGFCLQGDLCPFSHGDDAVVMTDVASLGLPTANATQQIPPVITSQPASNNIRPVIRNIPGICLASKLSSQLFKSRYRR